jgi:hypothetical protein
MRTPTVVWGPRSAPRGPPAASPPTTDAAPPAPTRPGFKASTHRPEASLPKRRTSVSRSPSTSTTQVGVSVSCAVSQPTRTASQRPEHQHRTPSTPQKVSLSPSSGRTTLTLWSICVACNNLRGTLSRAFTSLPPRRQPACARFHSRARSICRTLRAPGRLVKSKPGHDIGPDPFCCPHQH